MINPLIKVIELFVDEEQDAILQSISIVDKPAIEREFMYFSEDGRQMLFFQEIEDQRIVVSPAMIPDKMIPRKDDKGNIYYVYFSKDTVAKAAEYLMKYNKQSHSNVNHQRIYSNDMYVMESWIKESQNDKSTDYGFGDLPEGTWFVKFRIMNDDVWNKIKKGELKGLSVEGDFLLGAEKYEQAFGRYKKKYGYVRQKYKRAYAGLSEEEKSELDPIMYIVDLITKDAYETAEEAMKRSKELGLEGIRAEYNEAAGSINYLPGPEQALYEAALLKYEEMEIEVGTLPNYVNQGETGAKPLSQYEFQESYTDYPVSASNNAKKALEWRDKYPTEIQGGTQIGWTRANQLANRRPISEETIARMASFARHRQNAEVDPEKKDKPWTDAGYVAWLIWGGTTGVNWATDKLERIRRQRGQMAEEDLNINVFGYPTRFFYMCPGAIGTFQHLMTMDLDEDTIGMIRSAATTADRVFEIEKTVIDENMATLADLAEATILVDDFKDVMHEIDKATGMVHNVDYMDGHIEKIKSYITEELEFARYPWDECIADRLADGKSQEAAENICGWIKSRYSSEFEFAPASGKPGDRPLARIPKEERGRTGSAKNEPGDTKTTRGGIEVSAEVEKTLKDKIAKHNEENPQDSQKATLGQLKAVWRRGAGAYSIGTPGKRGMTRAQWAMARVNSFLNILAGKRSGYDKNYNQDNDLLPAGHPKSTKE